jgi:hypothetical protein
MCTFLVFEGTAILAVALHQADRLADHSRDDVMNCSKKCVFRPVQFRYSGRWLAGITHGPSSCDDEWEDEDTPPSREDLVDDDLLDPLPLDDDDVDFDDNRNDPEIPLEDLWDNFDEG